MKKGGGRKGTSCFSSEGRSVWSKKIMRANKIKPTSRGCFDGSFVMNFKILFKRGGVLIQKIKKKKKKKKEGRQR